VIAVRTRRAFEERFDDELDDMVEAGPVVSDVVRHQSGMS
jgi:hypothetical protein